MAVNSVGSSVASPSLSILAAQVPDAPTNVVQTYADQTSISIAWSAPIQTGSTAITAYRIYWDNASGVIIGTSIGNTSSSTLTFSQTGLTTNRYYTFAVSAVNIIGESSRTSSQPIITATIPGKPSTPILISQGKTSLNIGWNNPTNNGGTPLTGYRIEMDSGTSLSPNVFRTMQIQASTASNSFFTYTYLDSNGVAKQLKTGDVYKFRVTAINVVGEG